MCPELQNHSNNAIVEKLVVLNSREAGRSTNKQSDLSRFDLLSNKLLFL